MAQGEVLTVELLNGYRFEVEVGASADLATQARTLIDAGSVVEVHGAGSFTVYPLSQVRAIHCGEVPTTYVDVLQVEE